MYKAQTRLHGRTRPSHHCQQVLLQKNERLKVVGIDFRLFAKKKWTRFHLANWVANI